MKIDEPRLTEYLANQLEHHQNVVDTVTDKSSPTYWASRMALDLYKGNVSFGDLKKAPDGKTRFGITLMLPVDMTVEARKAGLFADMLDDETARANKVAKCMSLGMGDAIHMALLAAALGSEDGIE